MTVALLRQESYWTHTELDERAKYVHRQALGRSKDIRPSPLDCMARESSHGLPKLEGTCVGLGAGREGGVGLSRVCPAAGLDFIMFSKWLRREDTGFYWYISNMKSREYSGAYD